MGLASGILKLLLQIVLIIFSPVITLGVGILIMIVYNYIIEYRKGRRLQKLPDKYNVKKRGFLKKLLLDFPKVFIDDKFNKDPFDFEEHGLHMFTGRQGAGKTIALTHLIRVWSKRYPDLRKYTNMGLVGEDGVITHWKNVVGFNNGTHGAVMAIDEIQTWFSSNQSKNFPPEMITEISQQRKQRKCILGTAQVFSRIAKPIREQTTFVYCPKTFFGCLTIVRVTRPEYWDDEKQSFKKHIKTYFFVHDKELRSSYDTYKKIDKYTEEGFQEINPLRIASND